MDKATSKLYKVLKRDGYYTKSYEEFLKQLENPKYQDKVFNVISRDGLFTKSKEDFLDLYIKKKDDTELPSEDGSSESPKTEEPRVDRDLLQNRGYGPILTNPDDPFAIDEPIIPMEAETPTIPFVGEQLPNYEERFGIDGRDVTKDEYIASRDDALNTAPGINLNPFDSRANVYDGTTQDVEISYEPREGRNTETIQIPRGASEFEKRLATINAYQIDQEEEETVARFNYLFKDLGFEAEEGGGGVLMGMDSFTITAPNGRKKAFNLDPVFGDIFGGETDVAREIRQWMRNNMTDASREKNILMSNDEQYRVFYSMQQVQESVNDLNFYARAYEKQQQRFNTERTEWMQAQAVFENMPQENFQDAQIKADYQKHLETGRQLEQRYQDFIRGVQEFKNYNDVLLTQAGKYVTMKQEMGKGDMMWYPKQAWNAVTNTIGAILSTAYGFGQDVFAEGIEVGGVGIIPGLNDIYNAFGADEAIGQSEEDFKKDYLNVLKATNPKVYETIVAKFGDDPGSMSVSELREYTEKVLDYMTMTERRADDPLTAEAGEKLFGTGAAGNAAEEEIAEKARDQHLKRVKDRVTGRRADAKQPFRKYDDEGNLVAEIGDLAGYTADDWSGLRNIFTDYIGFSDVAEEADLAVRNNTFVWKGILGGIESLPAMVTTVKNVAKKSPTKSVGAVRKIFNDTRNYLMSRQGTQRSLQMSGFIVDGLNQEIANNPNFAYVTEQQKQAVQLPVALTSSALEVAGFRNLEKGQAFTGAVLKIALGKTTRRTTAKEFNKIVQDIVTNPYQYVALRTLAGGASEFETGFLQELSETEIKRLYNLVSDEQFNTPDFWTAEYVKNLLEAGTLEAIGGAAISSVGATYTMATSDRLQEVSDEMFSLYESVIDDPNFRVMYEANLKQEVIEGTKTQEEAETLMYQFDKLAGIKGSIPSDMSKANKKKAIALLLRKGEIEQQIDGKDENLTTKQRNELKAINQKLTDLSLETSMEQADAREGRSGIQIEATDEQAIEELKEEGVENPTPEQIKDKKDAIQKRSTETLDAQEPAEGSPEVGENVSQQEPTQEGEQKDETQDGQKTEEEVELDREAQEEADLEQVIGENVSPDEEVPENLFRNTEGTQENENENRSQKNTLYNRAKRGAKFLRRLFPDVKIVLYDNEDTYRKLRGIKKGFTESGFYDPNTKTIGINISGAARLNKTGVVAHEIAHAVLIETIRKAGGGSVAATKVTRRLIDAVYKSGNLSAKDKAKIEAFVQAGKYEENVRDEERFAEIINIIANNFNSFSSANKGKIRRLLDRLIDALPNKVKAALDRLGFNVLTASDQEIISFLQVLGGKIGSGQEGTAADVEVIEKLTKEESGKKKPSKPRKRNQKKKTQKEVVSDLLGEIEVATIKEIASITGLPEPTVRRILGQGAKKGEYGRVAPGVYTMKTKDGKTVAIVQGADARVEIKKLVAEGAKFDMVFLDPPYDAPGVTGGNRNLAKYKKLTPEEFSDFVADVVKLLRTPNTPVIFMFSAMKSNKAKLKAYSKAFTNNGLQQSGVGIETGKLNKDGKTRKKMFGRNLSEWVFMYTLSGEQRQDIDFKFDEELFFKQDSKYQTAKPVALLEAIIKASTKAGDLILDPFAGSGSTAKAAKKTGRNVVTIEEDQKQAQVIKEQVSGRKIVPGDFTNLFKDIFGLQIFGPGVSIKMFFNPLIGSEVGKEKKRDMDKMVRQAMKKAETYEEALSILREQNKFVDYQGPAMKEKKGKFKTRSNKLYNAYLAKWEAEQLRKEKARQAQENKSVALKRYELAEKYQMKTNGIINNLNFNYEQFEKEAGEVGLRPIPINNEVTGELTGYYFKTFSGKYVNPMKVKGNFNVRQSRVEDGADGDAIVNAGNNILEIVKIAVENGFTNDTIRRYLKRRNFSTAEINEALKIATEGVFDSLPKSFMNLPGGVKSGLSLMMKITGKYNELLERNRINNNYNQRLEKQAAKGNAPSTWYLKLRETMDQDEMMNEVIEYMKTLPEFQSATPSTQLLVERDVMLALNPTPNNYAASEVRKITAAIKSRKLAQLEIRTVQRFLRNFMRTVLPRDLYGKGEIIKLIDKVNALKSPEEVPAVVDEILAVVTEKANKSYMTSIFNILNRKSSKIEAGRFKGTRITDEVRQRIKKIGNMILNPKEGVDAIKKQINKLEERRIELEAKSDAITDEEINELDDIAVALIVNNAFMSEDNNPNKTEQLMEALSILTQLEVQGRTEFQAAIDEARNRYRQNFAMAFKEVTGIDLNWKDLSFDEAYKIVIDEFKGESSALGRIVDKEIKGEVLTGEEFLKLKDAIDKKIKNNWKEEKEKANDRLSRERQSAPVKSAVRRVARNVGVVGKKMVRFLDFNIIAAAEDLSGLMDRILSSSGELFGGPLMEFVTDSVRQSTREFKRQRRLQQGIFFDKYKEIYGKNWKKTVRGMGVVKPTGIYYNRAAHQELLDQKEKIKKSNASERTKKDLLLDIDKQILRNELNLSQNQMYYLYNQFKDPALRYANGVEGDPSKTLQNTFDPRRGLKTMVLYVFDSNGNLVLDNDGRFKRVNKNVQNEAESVLKDIEDNLDDRVKEWADWQVNIYYPSVYARYNDVYKKIYRISMPQNQYYAGRLFREAPENVKPITVLPEEKGAAYNPIAPDSTKVRLGSNKAIHFIDGDNALYNYMKDMEYFAAYAETIRDIYKVFSDPSMKAAIKDLHGQPINQYIEDAVYKIANKGSSLGAKQVQMINTFNTMFLLSRLGANLTLVVKQLTSIPTYGNDIGYRNWIKYVAISLTKIQKTYNEIMDNSVVLQDRYGYTVDVNGRKVYVKSTPIQKNIENYEDQQLVNMLPGRPAETIENITKYLMLTTMVGDRGAILIGGMPNYLYYKDLALKAGKTEEEAIQEAIIKFEKDTLKTQQSYDLQDKDYYQTGGPFTRAFNMFLTTPKQYFRREVVAIRNLHRKLVAWDINAGRGTLWQNVRTFLTYHFMMPMLFEYASQGFPGIMRTMTDDDKEELLVAGLLGNLNAIFLYGQALESAVDYLVLDKKYGSIPASLPVLEQISKLADLYSRAENASKEETRIRNMEKFYLELASTFGVPASQVKKIFDNYSQLVQGDFKGAGDAMLLIMGFSEYMRKRSDAKGDNELKLTEREKEKYIPGYKQRKQRLQNTPQYRKQQELRRLNNEKEKLNRRRLLEQRYGRGRR